MLKKPAKVQQLSPYSALYDILIPQDDILRRIDRIVDFSFIRDEIDGKYSVMEGRSAVEPIQMFKYLFLKVFFDLSDRGTVKRSMTDMAFKLFLGLNPEDPVVHTTSLTKFRRLRLQDDELLTHLLKKTINIAVENGVLSSRSIIVDATHTVSRFNQKSPVEALRLASKRLRKQLYQVRPEIKSELPEKNTVDDLDAKHAYVAQLLNVVKAHPEFAPFDAVNEAADQLEETQADIKESQQHSTDPDAKIGHKTVDSSFYGYKTHLAMTEDRIVTAAVITSGEKGDGQFLPDLVEQSIENGVAVESVTGDRAYSGKTNLEYAEKHHISLYSRLNPVIANGFRKNEWDYNKDAGMFVCPAGHMAICKAKQGKKNVGANRVITYYFDVERCQQCPLRDGCYKPGAKTKTYSISIKSDLHQQQMAFEETDEFKEKVRLRYMIEAKNAELKTRHGYGHTHSGGIQSMRLQGAMTLFVANVKRIDTLIGNKKKKQ